MKKKEILLIELTRRYDLLSNFTFEYEIGLAPDFEINITSKDKLDYYKIKADSKLIEGYCMDIAKDMAR